MLKDVCIFLDNFQLKNLNLSLDKNEVCFLFGLNGSGKTTILNTISGLIKPNSGSVYVSKKLFFLPADPIVDKNLKPIDLFDILNCKLEKVDFLVKEFEIEALLNKTISNISSGEYKRLWIVIALSYEAEVFLLDEPLVYLDKIFQYKLAESINFYISKKNGSKFLIATHEFSWSLGINNANAVIVHNTISKKDNLANVLQGSEFKNTFKLNTKLTDNPLDGSKIFATSKINF